MKKRLLFSIALLFGLFSQLLAQTPLNVLPSYGAVGVKLSTSAAGSFYTWFKRTNGIDTQISTGVSNAITVFVAGDCFVRVTAGNGSYTYGPVTTVGAEVPSTGINKVVTTSILHKGIKSEGDLILPNLTGSHGMNRITYMDPSGRPVQTIACQASPSRQDVIQPFEYSGTFAPPAKSHLAYTGSYQGNYHPNAVSEQIAFYAATGQKRVVETQPFSVSKYEASPMNTLLEQGSVGSVFQPQALPANGKTTKFAYRTNTAGEVVKWLFDGPSTRANGISAYPEGALMVSKETDPAGKVGYSYTDSYGNLIMKRREGTETYATYYVYDEKGRLVYEVPYSVNKTVTSFWSGDDVCIKYIHYYQYDALDRVWYHRPPGAAPVYSVYDRLNRPILVQDGEQRKLNQWSFVKYDQLGRTVFTGLYTDSRTREQLQTAIDAETVFYEERKEATTHGYSEDKAFPRLVAGNAAITLQILTANYYDDYNFDFDNSNQGGTPDVSLYANATEMFNNIPVPDYQATGKPTAVKKKVIGTSLQKWLWEVVFYNEMGRAVQVRSNSHEHGTYPAGTHLNTMLTNSTTSWLDFSGNVLNRLECSKQGSWY